MRGMSIRGAGLLALVLALIPAQAGAQVPSQTSLGGVGGGGDATGYAPAEPALWHPLGSTRPEDGGVFAAVQYVMFRQTNPLKDQIVAVRGFLTSDNSVPAPNGTNFNPGVFVGSRTEALNVNQVSGPSSYEPGYEASLGYKFGDGSTISLNFLYVATAQYRAVATLQPGGGNTRIDFADTFLTSYVYNFPAEFSGPSGGIAGGGALATFGIWDGASVMTEKFEQRFQRWELLWRKPVYEEECYRLSGIMGASFVWIWERYKWTTVKFSADFASGGAPEDTGIYTNIDSNRMYGSVIGCSNEYYIGHGFACQLDLKAGLYLDSVKERAKYERGDRFVGPENKRAVHDWFAVPSFEAVLGMMWYPTEAIQVYAGYDVMLFLNTVSSPRPIDFNYSSLTPPFETTTPRWFDGFRAGVAIHF